MCYSRFVIILVVLFGTFGMAQPPKLADDPDIASLRPRFKPNSVEIVTEQADVFVSKKYTDPNLDVTEKLNQSLDSVYVKNRQIKYGLGYRVLIYSGPDKAAVNQVKQKIYKLYPEEELYTVYKQPDYRVTFGDFIDKIHAYNYLAKIKSTIPEALIVQDQINIRTKRK